jgi:SNF2 family DNA or RNA helicase
VADGLDRTVRAIQAAPEEPAAAVWKDFEQHAAECYGRLGEIVDLGLDVQAAEGFLPADVVARVHEQQLDDQFRRVSLRGYQSFGARFALVQRRVIIGDEMGLGKTIEALAAIAHLKALGRTHFLVVCPASVLINWLRETAAHSRLLSYRLHGIDRTANVKAWIRRGDVAVTTFDSLRMLAIPSDLTVAMLVVDEAHFVKNPSAQRSQAVDAWTGRAERVLFLTGTPMENRVEEFKNLVRYLQPKAVAGIDGSQGVAGPVAFRRAVAPVYLRRNQEDVLAELPELVRADEWVEFGRHDSAAYHAAVAAGNFMAMRRAAYATADPRQSAKLQRLLEL